MFGILTLFLMMIMFFAGTLTKHGLQDLHSSHLLLDARDCKWMVVSDLYRIWADVERREGFRFIFTVL